MKNKSLLLSATLCLLTFGVFAQSTVFTYQGQLDTNGVPYSGSAEILFTVWDAGTNGNAIATNNAGSVITAVNNGLFTVTLDFGSGPFTGDPRFLQAEVRTAIGPFTALAPRQPLTTAPYALRALNLTTNGLASGIYGNAFTLNNAGNLFAGSFNGASTGSFAGNGSAISNVNATALGGVAATGFWATNGNIGTNPTNGAFLGTRDNLPLEIRVNGQRAFRLEPASNGAPNVIGGSLQNFVGPGVVGATIGGGGATNYQGFPATNSSQSDFGTVAGGFGNQIGLGGYVGSIGGGSGNTLNGAGNTISGGINNSLNTNAFTSTIGGGSDNAIQNNENSSAINGGSGNQIGVPPGFPSSFFQVGYNVIGGGAGNRIYALAEFSTIAGGMKNLIETNVNQSTIGGGAGNDIGMNSTNSVISGGNDNTILNNSSFAAIPGGDSNTATNYAFAAGRRAQAINQGVFVWADSQNADFISTANNQFLIRASGGVGIGKNNPATALDVNGTVNATSFSGSGSALSGIAPASGSANYIQNQTAADQTAGLRITGNGIFNGGRIGIGTPSPSRELEAQNSADVEIGMKSTDTGGHLWTLQSSAVTGSASLDASFQIVDRTASLSRFLIGTNGNVGIGTSNPTNKLHVNGGITCTALVQTSDRNAKENFAPISPDDVLIKVTALPISTWTYKEMRDGRHLGPMAQDFYAAFQLGGSDTTITAVDTEGSRVSRHSGPEPQTAGRDES